ncbi:MAG: sigma 54-interacting transcriptional regulator [Sedimentibacter sp.]|uniref:sigma-54 interaction domain-containing protein n=1 Tax=Sedimentibacter sp. TaxID=1960295 RepID=UPI0031583F6D
MEKEFYLSQLSPIKMGEFTGDAVYIVSKDGPIIDANGPCLNILGVSKEEIIGKTISDLWNMGVFREKNNFFLGYDEYAVPQLLRKLNEVDLEEFNVENAPRLSDLAFNEKKTVCGVTRLGNTEKVVLFISIPIFKSGAEKEVTHVAAVVRDLTDVIELKNKINKVEQNLDYYKKLQFRDTFIGDSQCMRKIKYLISQTAGIDTTVLISGETGTGKEVVAKEILMRSNRKDKHYIRINCGAIPENLFESELFGYEKGAFTGALQKGKTGLLEMANGGTVLLDEVEVLPMSMQAKLLRTLQEHEIIRVGGTENVKIDVRILATTNMDLEEMVANKQFREDLFYRLNVITIKIPPLRERGEDITSLANAFLNKFNEKYKKSKYYEPAAITRMEMHSWPGNVRDLEHTVERLVVIGDGNKITKDEVELAINGERVSMDVNLESLQHAVDVTEKRVIENAVKKYKSSRKVAEVLGVSQPTIIRKAKRLGIKLNQD